MRYLDEQDIAEIEAHVPHSLKHKHLVGVGVTKQGVLLVRADRKEVVVPFDLLPAREIKPDFSKPQVKQSGLKFGFGEYEVALEEIPME